MGGGGGLLLMSTYKAAKIEISPKVNVLKENLDYSVFDGLKTWGYRFGVVKLGYL